MTTFELTQKQLKITDCPDLITFLALAWLALVDLLNLAGPRLVRVQVSALVQYDRGCKVIRAELDAIDFAAKIGGAFLAFSFLFVLIQFLEGVVLWLR